MGDRFEITAAGARGSLPCTDPGGSRYAVNTACVGVRHGDRVAILDAGTGIVPLGRALLAEGVSEFDVILSHAHYDHVIGLPFFAPLFEPRARVTVWAAPTEGAADGAALLSALIGPPFLPFTPAMLRCELRHAALQPGTPQDLGGGTLLRSVPVFHPGGGVALRIDRGGRGFVYAPDFDFDDGPCDAALAGLLSGAALAFLDCTYTPDDYDLHRGYGHAHWRHCAEIANAAGLPRWGLFHHAQSRSDAEIAEIEARVQALSPGAFAVREGETHAL